MRMSLWIPIAALLGTVPIRGTALLRPVKIGLLLAAGLTVTARVVVLPGMAAAAAVGDTAEAFSGEATAADPDVQAVGGSAVSQQAALAAAIVPAPGDDLRHEGELALYRGEQLYDYIDGGAPQFIEYGFHEVASQELTYKGHTYIFDVYRMQDPLAAYGIFSTRRPTEAEPLAGFPHSSYATYQGLIAHGPFLIEIAAYEATPQTATEMAQLAQRGTAALAAEPMPADLSQAPPFTHLPLEGRIPGSEKLARGPVGLRIGLGTAAQGPFFAALEAALGSSAESAGTDRTAARQTSDWVIARYGGRPGRADPSTTSLTTPAATAPLASATTLAVLIDPGSRSPSGSGFEVADILARAGSALQDAGAVTELPAGNGWIVTSPAGPQLCVVRVAGDLLFGVSRLPPEVFRMWIAGVVSGS